MQISSQPSSFSPFSTAAPNARRALAEAKQQILSDGNVARTEIPILDRLQISSAAKTGSTDQPKVPSQARNPELEQAQASLGFVARLQERLGNEEPLTKADQDSLRSELNTRQSNLRQSISRFESALKEPGLSPDMREVLALELSVLQQEERLYTRLDSDLRRLETSSAASLPAAEKEPDPLSPQIRQTLESERIPPALREQIQGLSALGRRTLNENPALLARFANASRQITEGLQGAGRTGSEKLGQNLNRAFANFLESQNAQNLAMVAGAPPANPQIAAFLLQETGIAEISRVADLQRQIQPFKDAAGLLSLGKVELDLGQDAQGKPLIVRGQDLNKDNYVQVLAQAAAELGVNPQTFARFLRQQLQANLEQTRFVLDTPEKKAAFVTASTEAALSPAQLSADFIATAGAAFANLKEGLETPQKMVGKEFLAGEGLAREDATPQKINESLKTLADPNASNLDKLSAAGTLVQVYKGFLERFDVVADPDLKQKLLQGFLGPGKSPEDFIKGLDGIGALLGTPGNLRDISRNFQTLFQGAAPIAFEVQPGSNALQLPTGKANLLSAGDTVRIGEKSFKVASVDSAKNTVVLDPPPALAKGELRLDLSFKDKAVKGFEIVTKTADIIEGARNLAEVSPLIAKAAEKAAKFVRDEAKLLKGAISTLVKDAKLAEQVGEFVNSLQKTFNALSPGVGDQFITALNQRPELLKKLVGFGSSVGNVIGLDKLNKGLQELLPKIVALGPEKIAEATQAASGPSQAVLKAESRIPVLGFLANAGFLAKDIGTLISDLNAGKDDFTHFNNFVSVVSDVAAFSPATQTLSLLLDSYSIGIGIGTLINEGTGLKETIQERVKTGLGINEGQLAADNFLTGLNQNGVIGQAEFLLRTGQSGTGRAIVQSQGDAGFKNLISQAIDTDLRAGRISQSEALIFRRNAYLPGPDGKIAPTPEQNQAIQAQIQQDLSSGKITRAEALIFTQALGQDPPTSLAGIPQTSGSRIQVGSEGAPLAPTPIPLILAEGDEKAALAPLPILEQTGTEPLLEIVLPAGPGPVKFSSEAMKTDRIDIPVPPTPTPEEPEISLQIPENAPVSFPLAEGREGIQIQVEIPRLNGRPVTRAEVDAEIQALNTQVLQEQNPVQRSLLQARLDRIRLFVNQGAPGSLRPLF